MIQTKTAILDRTSTKVMIFAFFLALSVAAPLIKIQLITGPLVNATLFLAVIYLGAREAMLIGLIPSLISLSVGLLSPVLAPMIPFIMLSNVLLVFVFDIVRNRSEPAGFVIAAIIKFAFLYFMASVVIRLIPNPIFAQKAVLTMGSIQLITALIGAVIAMTVQKSRLFFSK